MFRTALIAVDHSTAEGPLLDCLSDLRDMGVSRVFLLHVLHVGFGQGAGYGNRNLIEEWLDNRAVPLCDAGLEVTAEVLAAGDIAREILEYATRRDAELIVIGSRGQNMLRGLFLGSVAREVIRQSQLPVRLEWIEANGEDGDTSYSRSCHAGMRRLLLATDFSAQSQSAEQAAISLARRGAHVDVVHVLEPGDKRIYARWANMAKAAMSYIVEDVITAGGMADMHLLDGQPAAEIARLAAARDTDLIILGRQGQSWIKSATIGSTAAKLCEIARRPVLMVPRQDDT